MKYNIITFLIVLCSKCILLTGCKKKNTDEVAATIGNENVLLKEIDNTVQNSLFESLYSIYRIRTIALEDIIDESVIKKEANLLGVTADSLITKELNLSAQHLPLDSFIVQNGLRNGVINPEKPFKLIKLTTTEGREILNKTYREYLRQQLIDKLKTKYGTKILLAPPLPPALNLSGINFHSRGAISSPNTICIISDFTCSSCKEQAPLLDAIYNKFKNRIHFKYAQFASDINPNITLSECAGRQEKYWQAYAYLLRNNVFQETEIDKAITALNLDKAKCKECIKGFDHTETITNIQRMSDLKINATPTIIINNRVYFGELTIPAIAQYLDLISSKE